MNPEQQQRHTLLVGLCNWRGLDPLFKHVFLNQPVQIQAASIKAFGHFI
jgi:hypothetical protein